MLWFLAETNHQLLNKTFASLLLVCGVSTRNVRDPALFACLRRVAPTVRRLASLCVGSFCLPKLAY